MEFRVWPDLIQQSSGLLHTFLPLLDRGLDAAIHRLTDDVYIPIQVKGTDRIVASSIEITIHGYNFVDDKALIIAGLLTEDGLGPTLLVLDEGTFKRPAAHTVVDGVDVYSAHFATTPTAANRWRPYLVPRERLAARLLKTDPPLSAIETFRIDLGLEPRDRHNLWLGFLGESEVIRRLAENSQLDLFRPFPDLEWVEVLAMDNVSRRFAGLQVKTAAAARKGEAQIHIQKIDVRALAINIGDCLGVARGSAPVLRRVPTDSVRATPRGHSR